MRPVAPLKGRAPANRGGASLTGLSAFVDRYFLAFASWPSLLVMLGVTAVPFPLPRGLRLTNYVLGRAAWNFVGFRNFTDLYHDPQMPRIIFNTAYLVIGSTII